MRVCGTIVEIKRATEEALSAGLRGFPKVVENVRGLVEGRFRGARKVNAAQ